MSRKPFMFILIILTSTVAACSQAKPTPIFLPTRTALPITSTLTASQTATLTPVAAIQPSSETQSTPEPVPTRSPVASHTPDSPRVEPTQPSSPQTVEQVFPPNIALEPMLSGFQSPVYLTYANASPPWGSRLFVVEKAGRILVIENDQVQPVPFLDITDRVGSSGSEQGLLSVAFPPDFDASGEFYVNYTNQRGDTVVSRYQLLENQPPQGDPSSEQKLLEITQPATNHNGGQLQFGPDGYLYIGTGDGGRAGDPWGNAQNPGVLLGKMLRIDVAGTDTYRIPNGNPFLNWTNVRSEIWALGIRNPWRFSFDRVTGDLYIADVGQNAYEEISFQSASSVGGENYGWDIMESKHCYEPEDNCDTTGVTLPVAEYDHSQGCSITGGYVYRGMRYPQMTGVYFFGDFCSGRIWGLRRAPSGEWNMALLLETEATISSFGQDATGELYVVSYRDGTIHRLAALP